MPQKLLLALLIASRKLRHYFQGHPIRVVSAYPLEKVLRSPNAAGRIAEWNIELQAFQLEFSTTRVIRGAALADFVVEWTDSPAQGVGEDRSLTPGDEAPDGWIVYFDSAFSRQGAGAGAVLISPTQDKLYYAVQLCFQHGGKVANNIMEYEGLIAGLKAAAALGVRRLTIRGDSQLLVNFSNKEYKPKDEHMEAYLEEVRKIEKRFLVGMKTARKRTKLGATIFVFIFFCRSGNKYRNPGNEYENR
jgi:ribonuclease HI